MKTFLKIIGIIALFILVLLFSLLTGIDRTPYQEMDYYKTWENTITQKEYAGSSTSGDSMKVGWSKVNITPDYATPMAGYGKRKGEHFTAVHDSIFVRTICIDLAGHKQFLISLDMLIVPPSITEIVKNGTQVPFENIYLSATHSHNSIGGWYNTLVGKLFAGKYDPNIEKMVGENVLKSMKAAEMNMMLAKVTYEENIDSMHIYNRLVREKGTIDPEIRSIKFVGAQDSIILTTYAAHSTILDAATMELSRDYPGVLVDQLEGSGYAFASFMAGAVGSMGPVQVGDTDFEQVENQGINVKNEVISIPEKTELFGKQEILKSFYATLPLRKPSPKVTPTIAMRPWVFNWLFGDYPPFLKSMRIGNILLVGMPCDFSGELMKDLDNYAAKNGLQLIVTSFNGAYAGYITADQYFDMDNYETVTMNWYGPENGAYFSEAIRNIVDEMK
ncbi:Neutral/alkaline non-lysosomal ceramidase, N-terminal [Spirosomataceae bacterium TFI 002]|nr:Neutral/alkaline non-lysosomal ceramidase, N-terminal [Spirosomataceae bacterium TFI 002]